MQRMQISYSLKTTICSHTIFISLSSAMKQLFEKLNFELLHTFNFSCTWNKETSSCKWSIATFQPNIPYMVNSCVFSVDIPVTINILYKVIKILHEKMLNVIYFYWFHSDTLVENNALNGHSNQPWTNEWRFAISPVK